jgi:hypothetical protein
MIKNMQDWEKEIVQLNLDDRIYPNSIVGDYLLLTKDEIERLVEKTKRRIKIYNKIKPKDWAGYSDYEIIK